MALFWDFVKRYGKTNRVFFHTANFSVRGTIRVRNCNFFKPSDGGYTVQKYGKVFEISACTVRRKPCFWQFGNWKWRFWRFYSGFNIEMPKKRSISPEMRFPPGFLTKISNPVGFPASRLFYNGFWRFHGLFSEEIAWFIVDFGSFWVVFGRFWTFLRKKLAKYIGLFQRFHLCSENPMVFDDFEGFWLYVVKTLWFLTILKVFDEFWSIFIDFWMFLNNFE